ncbi:MAG: pyruvate oxidase [Bryobacteraceae bacterium]|nr:pyruvate oxidase [Bryobacteraceae bacterium]
MNWGVDTVYGIPGDGINGLIEGFRKRQDDIRFIQTRHEESAALMACAHAKFTGRLGVCVATSGPGGIHLLNGLYDAKLDGAPVLAITGLQFHDLIGTHTQQDVALDKLFMDVCVYNERVMGPNHVEQLVDLACRTALAYRGVAHLTVPVDIQEKTPDEGFISKRNQPHHSADLFRRGGRAPEENDLRLAADLLNAGKRVMILAGQGALGAGAELEQTAELLGAPIAKALLGKAAVPDSSPYTTGAIGLLGTRPSQEAMEDCDTLLIVGSAFPYIEFYPKPGTVKSIQVDVNPANIGLRHPVDVGLVGDSKHTLRKLIPLLKRKKNRGFLEDAQKGMKEWRELMRTRSSVESMPMKPQVVAAQIDKYAADDAIIASDSGTITTWWARHIQARGNRMFSCSGNLATMACALPYAIAAQAAYPKRQCIAFLGDGGFSMLMGEFATCVKYDLPVKVFVISNRSLGQIKWEQMVFLGNPEYVCDLQPIDFAKFAEACGVKGIRVDRPGDCGDAVREALASRGPVIVDAIVDPQEAPMPPMVNLTQARKFAESLVRGTPNRKQIVKTLAANKIREMV